MCYFITYKHAEVPIELTLKHPMIKTYKNSYQNSRNCKKNTTKLAHL
jgi:hypothetical protein